MICNKNLDNVVWELTLKCNAHCIHCGSSAGKTRENDLTRTEIYNLCDQLSEVNCKKVNLIGGEAFLHPLWREVIIRLRIAGIQVSIITNGLCLDDEKISFMAEQGVSTIGISLDGATAGVHDYIRKVPGLYDKIFSLENSFDKAPMYKVAITTLNNINITEMKSFRNKLKNSFFDAWQIQIGAPYGRMKDDISLSPLEYYIAGLFIGCSQKSLDNKELAIFGMHDFGYYSDVIAPKVNIFADNWQGCPAGKHLLGIRSDGKVYGCLSMYDDKFIEGDLRQNSLKEIWESSATCSWNQRFNKIKNLKGFCKECDYRVACCGGCGDVAHSYSGDVGENPLCFHAIEEKYRNYKGEDKHAQLLKTLTTSTIDDEGKLVLANGIPISSEYIDGLELSDKTKALLKFFI